jgi:hypothetical protein
VAGGRQLQRRRHVPGAGAVAGRLPRPELRRAGPMQQVSLPPTPLVLANVLCGLRAQYSAHGRSAWGDVRV